MSSPIIFQQFRPASLPGFAQGPNYQNFEGALGYTNDIYVEYVIAGLEARFLNTCNDVDLYHHGNERGLPMYAVDTFDSYRARLQNAFVQWQEWGGTAKGIADELNAAGFMTVRIFENSWWGTDPNLWAQFWVVIDDRSAHTFGIPLFLGDLTLGGTPGVDGCGSGALLGFDLLGFSGSDQPAFQDVPMIDRIVKTWQPGYDLMREHHRPASGLPTRGL